MSSVSNNIHHRASRPTRLTMERSDRAITLNSDANLLVGFGFGPADSAANARVLDTGLMPIRQDPITEYWWYDGEVGFEHQDGVGVASCDDYAVFSLRLEFDDAADFSIVSRDAYRALLTTVSRSQYRHIAKIWNYFGDITTGDGDDERYRQFSIGRAQVFAEHGLADQGYPAGTAIGTHQTGALSIVALASRQSFIPVENPRQVSAYRYPRQFGPESPSFSRGATLMSGDDELHLVSGTAAIVGYRSQHPQSVERQLLTTIDNLRGLFEKLAAESTSAHPISLQHLDAPRFYLRHVEDYDTVVEILDRELGAGFSDRVLFLHADICRRELLLEIDGVALRPR